MPDGLGAVADLADHFGTSLADAVEAMGMALRGSWAIAPWLNAMAAQRRRAEEIEAILHSPLWGLDRSRA